jgi:2-dehydro-3-deoxygluconokinase
MPQYDVITLGETMLRLSPPGMLRMEQAQSLDMHIGGTESNTAVGLARLGLHVCWISRLTDNPLGHYIAGTIAHHGVDTGHVIWTDEDRVGVYFIEPGKLPRGTRVTYDRANSAVSKMTSDDLPSELFHADGARLLHLTGITPAIGADAAAAAHHALKLAKDAGWMVSFDLNYRAKLWTPEGARAGCEPFMSAADVLFVPLGDARTVFDFEDEAETVLAALAEHYPQAVIIMTLGADGAIARAPGGYFHRQPAFPAEEVDRIGGGDAFSAGFLYGYLTAEGADRLAVALRWGAAVAALKYTIPGDLPLIERAEVEALVYGSGGTKLAR